MSDADEPHTPGQDDAASPEEVRRYYLSTEASIQTIGSLYYLIAGLGVVFAGALIVDDSGKLTERVPQAVFTLLAGVFAGWAGFCLQKLDKRGQSAAGIVAMFSLLLFPCGTAMGAYCLYLLCSARGSYLFSDEYGQIRAATPHLKYRLTAVRWLVIVAAGVIAAMLLVVLMEGVQRARHLVPAAQRR